MTIYQDIILDHYRSPRNKKRLGQKAKTIHVANPFCGDVIDMDIIVNRGIVVQIGFAGDGCAISQASASMLTDYVAHKSIKELRNFDKNAMIELLGIELTPTRLKCGLLAWEAFQKLIHTI